MVPRPEQTCNLNSESFYSATATLRKTTTTHIMSILKAILFWRARHEGKAILTQQTPSICGGAQTATRLLRLPAG